jgi:hypothetical protein
VDELAGRVIGVVVDTGQPLQLNVQARLLADLA